MRNLLEIKNLVKHYSPEPGRIVRAVDGVDLHIEAGTTLGLVGESGSGKSTIAKLIMSLEKPTSGEIKLGDKVLSELKGSELRRSRNDYQMVFQNPFDALNRRKRVVDALSLPLEIHTGLNAKERLDRCLELLDLVGLRKEMLERYPHQMSGGQCQRVGIARALALNPKLVILDEAVSAVDVSIQAQILNLLRDLQAQLGLTYLFISHDLSIVRYMSQNIAVLYQGKLAELGSRDSLFASPKHPYTLSLMNSIPNPFQNSKLSFNSPSIDEDKLKIAKGCRFLPRCERATRSEICITQEPTLRFIDKSLVACHFAESDQALSSK
jgi:oligopeptide/dipeptide ABC transporter ATP-binding protein